MRILTCAFCIFIASFAVDSVLSAEEEWKPKTHFDSPDERFSVEIQASEKPEKEGFNDQTLVLRAGKKELARETTFGFLLDVYWDETGNYVAIDNRRGNGGDYVWIFTLPDGKRIKQADSDQFSFLTRYASTAIEKIDAHATGDKLQKFRIVAKGWWGRGPKLLVRIVARFDYPSGGDRADVHWFVYDAVVKIADGNFSLVSGEARKVQYVND